MVKQIFFSALVIISSFLSLQFSASAQINYQNKRLTVGQTDPYSFYDITLGINGIYVNRATNRFLQFDVSTIGAPRIAGHNNQVVFYNTQTGTFNSIQVSSVLNHSDALAKTGVRTLNNGLDILSHLRPVSYNFINGEARKTTYNQFTGSNAEFGLIAQELEAVLPNLVHTDEEGHKLVNYIALIPVLIDAVKTLQQEVETLKNNQKQ